MSEVTRSGWCRREEHRHRAALGLRRGGRALEARGVHHGADVLGLLLERRAPRAAIGEARPVLVEEDQAGERRQALEPPAMRGSSHRCSTCENAGGDVDEVMRAVADDLIGEVHAVARPAYLVVGVIAGEAEANG